MAGTAKTRAQLATDPGAPLRTGHVPTNAEFQDVVASSFNLLDDDASDIAVDAITDALWEGEYGDTLPEDAQGRKLLTGLLNKLLTEHLSLGQNISFWCNSLDDIRQGNIHPLALKVDALGHTDPGDGGGGPFYADASDTTSTDNNGTVVVDVHGVRWKRPIFGNAYLRMFGGKLNNSTDDATAWANALTYCNTNKIPLIADARGGAVTTLVASQVSVPAWHDVRAEGDVTIKFTSASAEIGFNCAASTYARFHGFKWATSGTVNQFLVYATGSTNIKVKHNEFDWAGATAALASNEDGGLDFTNVSDLEIAHNKFRNSWRDTNYDASDEGGTTGNNLLRAINIMNTAATDGGVNIHHNEFDDVWSAMYVDNVNSARIEHNDIDTTASTAMFERCTSGTTYNKWVQFNRIKNCGKTPIKVLDANNLTAKGHNAWVVGNEIENWGIYVSSGAILAANYYDYGGTSAYLEAPDGSRSTGLRVSRNIVRETSASSCGVLFQINNQDRAVISENECELLTTSVNNILQWSNDCTISNNTFKTSGWFKIYDCTRVKIDANSFNMAKYFEMDSQSEFFDFTRNTVSNSEASPSQDYGVHFSNNNTYCEGKITDNIFITAIAVQDDDETTNINVVRLPSTSSVVLVTDNVVKFEGATSGTAQAGAATTITLATSAMRRDDIYNSETITITGGTGSGQSKTITDYVGSTRVCTVDSAWAVNPDNTSTYSITGGQVLTQIMGFGTLKYPSYFKGLQGNAAYDQTNTQIDYAKSNIRADTGAIAVGADTA